jgi:guanylate kinase
VVQRRLAKAKEELEHYNEYQHLIINDELDRAYAMLKAIYLTRCGSTDPELHRLVEVNKASGAEAHARQLVGRI